MNPHFVPFVTRNVDHLGRDGDTRELLEQRTDLTAQRAARNIGTPGGVFDHGIIRAANFERPFARADMQPGFAMQFPFENQFSD